LVNATSISRLNDINNSTSSIYVGSKKNPIYQAFEDIYTELGLNTDNNKFSKYKEMFDK